MVEAVESYWIGLRPVENATIYGRARTLLQVRDDESYGVARVNLNDSNSVDADGRLWEIVCQHQSSRTERSPRGRWRRK